MFRTAAVPSMEARIEKGLVWQIPRTKGSTGYPDAIRERVFFRGKTALREALLRPAGRYEKLGGPEAMIAEGGDTHMKYPDDETFPQLMVNYLKLDRVPKFNDGWTPVTDALRAGDYFVTSSEVVFGNWGIEGSGAKRTYTAEAEWTFAPEFAELVWSDGDKIDRQVISLTEKGSIHEPQIPCAV